MIDSHSHIYMPEFDDDRAEVVARCREAGVTEVVAPNVDLESLPQLAAAVEAFPGFFHPAMGLHPTSVTASWRADLDAIIAELDRGGYVAVGEIGMDLYWDTTMEAEQRVVLAEQLRYAYAAGLPAIIHCREALNATLEVIASLGSQRPQLVMHSFTGSPEDVEAVRRVVPDAFFGVNGIVTFKNAHLEPMVEAIGIDRLLLETDSPYLAPVPYRGRRNESSYVALVAAKIAEIFALPLSEIDALTTATTRTIFRL